MCLGREKMAQAYDFALDKIGMEIMSYQVSVSSKCRAFHSLNPNVPLTRFVRSADLGGLYQLSQRSVSMLHFKEERVFFPLFFF